MKFPVNSLLAGNLGLPETSSLLTASSSGESIAEPDFLDQDGTEHPQLVEIGREVSI